MRFKDSPEPAMILPGSENKVMYSSFRVGDAIMLASDGRCQGQTNFQGISLALTVPNEAVAEQRFAALSDDGQVQIPLAETFFSPRLPPHRMIRPRGPAGNGSIDLQQGTKQ
jgi:PhnB protein